MLNRERFNRIQLLLILAWLLGGALVVTGFLRNEGELSDPNTIALLDYGISNKHIRVTQARRGEPLRFEVDSFESVPPPEISSQGREPSIVFDERQWRRVEQLVGQFVAAANWGLSDPFEYAEQDGLLYVSGFNSRDFTYHNPYDDKRQESATVPIKASSSNQQTRGWRVVGPGVVVLVDEKAGRDEVVLQPGGEFYNGVAPVAKRLMLRAAGGGGLRLQFGLSLLADQKDRETRLLLQKIDAQGKAVGTPKMLKSGDYFIWESEPWVVYDTAGEATREPTSANQPGSLVFTKYVNNRPIRVHLLGEATTNLLGARLGGYLPYFEGALNHGLASQVTLTLDPELQAGSFALLRNALEKIDGSHYRGRPRRGAVTILEADTGNILAHAGFPSYDADWAERRRVLVNRSNIAQNPANDVHMAGSTIKVLTVAMGYLLFGSAQSELLPTSINDLAIKQAFQDVYGVELNAPLIGSKGLVTPQAKEQFNKVGGRNRVRPEFLETLQRVFLVSPTTQAAEPEQIVSSDMLRFFNEVKLKEGFLPSASRFPVLEADSMERFRHFALGTEESRFTTLRLASILATVSEGKVVRPNIIESIVDKSGNIIKPQNVALSDIDVTVKGIEARVPKMRFEMAQALRKVLLPGGTGFFFNDNDKRLYLGQDDPDTAADEGRLRASNFGKSGTADYGDEEKFQDSLFVYRHGRYVIAVWLELADRGEYVDPEHRFFERHPAHKLTHRILQLIESIENQP